MPHTIETSPIDRHQGGHERPRTAIDLVSDQIEHPESHAARLYKQLVPLSKPVVGEQYAFRVDLDKCTGCKACVAACHSLNGLDDNETWRDVGEIVGGDPTAAYRQTITTACHHCADPACLNGCPVLAYEKDPLTGIVHHLDDQCIGCQYCVLKCPYDVPKYSEKLGIVRKCDMCHSRLATGEAPACVQACPTEAISITIVNTTAPGRGTAAFLPAAPAPDYTAPTTQYVSQRPIPANAQAADHAALRPEPAHVPLVIMLILTQLAAGLYTVSFLAGAGPATQTTNIAAFVFLSLGLAASVAHLGRPAGAWRAFLGLRRSWLSREIVVFGLFAGCAAVYTMAPFAGAFSATAIQPLGVATVLTGLGGVFCSVMIYHDTRREAWRFPVSAGKFFGTACGLGVAGFVAIGITVNDGPAPGSLVLLTAGLFAAKLGGEGPRFRALWDKGFGPRKKSALLLVKPLRRWTVARFAFGLGGIVLFLTPALTPAMALAGFVLLLAGEILERVLYFKAVVAPKMPGGL